MNERENAFDYYYCSILDEYNSTIFFFFFMCFFAVKYDFLWCHCYSGSNGAYMCCAHTEIKYEKKSLNHTIECEKKAWSGGKGTGTLWQVNNERNESHLNFNYVNKCINFWLNAKRTSWNFHLKWFIFSCLKIVQWIAVVHCHYIASFYLVSFRFLQSMSRFVEMARLLQRSVLLLTMRSITIWRIKSCQCLNCTWSTQRMAPAVSKRAHYLGKQHSIYTLLTIFFLALWSLKN